VTRLQPLLDAVWAGDPVIFHEPDLLWLLLVAPLLVLVLPRDRLTGARARNLAALGVRLVACSALVIAAARPVIQTQVPAVSLVIAVDKSASMAPERVAAMIARAEALIAAAGPDVPVTWVSLEDADAPEAALRGADDGTDLAGLLSLASQAGPPAPTRRVLVLSDGAHNRGDALASVAASAAGAGVELFPLAPQTDPVNAGVLDVVVPDGVMEGDEVTVLATVLASRSGPVEVEVVGDGRVLVSESLTARGGTQPVSLSFPAPDAGTHRLTVQARAPGDLWADDDARGAWLVTRRDGAVWLRGPEALVTPVQDRLKAQGRRTRWSPDWSESVPPETTLFVLDPDLAGWPDDRAAALASRVRNAGVDLVLAGDSDGMAHDQDHMEPLNRALPVKFSRRREPRPAPLSIVFILDTSGSMDRGNKLDLAVSAVVSAVDKLHPDSNVAVLSFSDHYEWIVRFTKAEQAVRIREALEQMTSSGGTTMYPALAEAGRRLAAEKSVLRHALLLTDGRSLTRLQQNQQVIRRLIADEITVSTVAISDDSARTELEQVADLTGGRAWYTETWDDLPRILVEETVMVVGKDTVDKIDQPWPVPESPLAGTVDWDRALPLAGHNASRARPTADLGLMLGEGGDPLVASWRYGAGSVTVFTSELATGWGQPWTAWDELDEWLDQLIDAVRERPPQEQAALSLETSDDGVGIRLATHDALGNARSGLRPTARVRGDSGERKVALVEDARGLYRATVPWDGPVLVTAEVPGDVSLPPTRVQAQAAAPAPLELQGALEDREALGLLARATGGVVEPSAEELFRDLKTRLQEWVLWPWFAWLGLIAMLCDVAIRRLRVPRLFARRPSPTAKA
jgi:Ca-activated chloride channel homolog